MLESRPLQARNLWHEIANRSGSGRGDSPIRLTYGRGDPVGRPTKGKQMQRRRSLRLPGYNYGENGVFFVTVCTHLKRCIFGTVVEDMMHPNEWGRIVEEEWLRAETLRPNVELDLFALMPNHFHGILIMRDDQEQAHQLNEASKSKTLQSGSLGAIVGQFKSIVSKRICRLSNAPDYPIWQRNYYESIIRTREVLKRARDYIATNPMRWREDVYYVE